MDYYALLTMCLSIKNSYVQSKQVPDTDDTWSESYGIRTNEVGNPPHTSNSDADEEMTSQTPEILPSTEGNILFLKTSKPKFLVFRKIYVIKE